MKRFNYTGLPLGKIAEAYRQGTSWRELARVYGCPDHKTLAKHVTHRFPDMAVRNHAEAQRTRREREGKGRRAKSSARPKWWGNGGSLE